MIVWVLRKIYYCVLLNVIVTNCCMNIMKNLLLCLIKSNCNEWLYEYYKDLRCIILNVNYHGWLYEYYEGSIVVLYWTLIVMNGWMSNMKGVLLCYWMLNCYEMFCLCITKDLLLRSLNVKLLRNVCMMRGLLLCCSECQVVMNRLNEQFKGYYHVIWFINCLWNVWLVDD
jgi:hypothetical protein